MGAVALDDARGAQWTKLLFNAATNPLAALTGLTHGELCDRPALRALAGALVAEGRAVADALGIVLDADPDAVISRAARENHDHKPSTQFGQVISLLRTTRLAGPELPLWAPRERRDARFAGGFTGNKKAEPFPTCSAVLINCCVSLLSGISIQQ